MRKPPDTKASISGRFRRMTYKATDTGHSAKVMVECSIFLHEEYDVLDISQAAGICSGCDSQGRKASP